jgi:hypothetical protein
MVAKKNGKLFIGMKTILFIFALLFPLTAHAQDEEESRKVIYKQRTEIDFDSVDVNGELIKPAGALLIDRKRAKFNPLIRLRTDWKDEMKKSIDKVK